MQCLLARSLHQLRLLFIALQFFTRLPVPRWVGFEPEWLHHASRYFTAVGIIVGAIVATVYAVASWMLPQVVAVLLSTAAGIYLTGAFHEDGFADTCDGLGGGVNKARVLEIMVDSRIGAYGAIGIGLLLALKVAALANLPSHAVAAVLLAAHPLSRLASVALIWRLEYVKVEGKAKPLAQEISTAELVIAVAAVVLLLAALLFAEAISWRAIVAGAMASTITAMWMARKIVQRIGGYTGDCLGAVQQMAEVTFYVAVLAVAH